MYVDKYDFFVLFFEYLLLKLGGLIETAVGIHYCFENVIRKLLDKTRVIKNICIDYVFKMFPKTKNSFEQQWKSFASSIYQSLVQVNYLLAYSLKTLTKVKMWYGRIMSFIYIYCLKY